MPPSPSARSRNPHRRPTDRPNHESHPPLDGLVVSGLVELALGGLTVLAGSALPALPPKVKWPLDIGAWTNAMSFGVLVARPDLKDHPVYRAAVGASFTSTSSGFVSLAHEGFARWRAQGRAA